MHVEFIRNYRAYSPGDVAGFDPSVAEVLVQKRIAVLKKWDEDPTPQVEAQGHATDEGDPQQENQTVSADVSDPAEQEDQAETVDEDATTETEKKASGRRK